MTGNNQAGNPAPHQLIQFLHARFSRLHLQIGHFHIAQELNTVSTEMFIRTRQLQTRAGYVRNRNENVLRVAEGSKLLEFKLINNVL